MSANSDNIILTFDEPIIAGTGNIVLTPSSGSAISIDVTDTSLVTFSSNVCTINPSGNLDATGLTYTVTMASGVIKNSNGDLFNGISGTAYQFNSKDTTSATVSNVTSSTTNGSYKTDHVISIQVVFTETVVVTGTPQLTLETGTNDAVVNYASGSGSNNTLTFTYTISSGHNLGDLDYKRTSSLSLNGGTIKDAAGNSATLTLPYTDRLATGSLGANKRIVVDTTAPYLDNPNNIGTTTDTTPTFTFNSDEAGTITSSLSFSTSNSLINGPNSITFNTLGNADYPSEWVKVTDAVGNISNTLYIPSFTVAANPYGTTDLRYYMWEQNHGNFSGSTWY